jgi:hypothetical protein
MSGVAVMAFVNARHRVAGMWLGPLLMMMSVSRFIHHRLLQYSKGFFLHTVFA